MSEAPEALRAISGSFTITCTLTDKRQIQMSGHVYTDDNPAELNKRVDWYMDTVDRQSVRSSISNKKAEIAQHVSNLNLYKSSFDELVKKQKRGKKLMTNEQQAVDNYDAGVRRGTEEIQRLESEIEAAEKFLKE